MNLDQIQYVYRGEERIYLMLEINETIAKCKHYKYFEVISRRKEQLTGKCKI